MGRLRRDFRARPGSTCVMRGACLRPLCRAAADAAVWQAQRRSAGQRSAAQQEAGPAPTLQCLLRLHLRCCRLRPTARRSHECLPHHASSRCPLVLLHVCTFWSSGICICWCVSCRCATHGSARLGTSPSAAEVGHCKPLVELSETRDTGLHPPWPTATLATTPGCVQQQGTSMQMQQQRAAKQSPARAS